MFLNPEDKEELPFDPEEFYQATKDLPFPAWIQLLEGVWDEQSRNLKLKGYLTALQPPEE